MAAFAVITAVPLVLFAKSDKPRTFSTHVDAQGGIRKPSEYRSSWVHLGSWVVLDEKAPGYGFHDVYTQPATVKAFKATGKFPDGAILIKEIRKVNSGLKTTGQANWGADVAVWFVMVKDMKGRFRNHPNWGDGWGWALYEAKDPSRNISSDYKTDCLPCHVPAKNTDWVFMDGYPTLR
ncbi:MAG: cytochrome P460 family protein [Syntrophobacteraceae bacterium]|nr:cytochrome P460 family protein [Syntrophobacteraceae bacterium]